MIALIDAMPRPLLYRDARDLALCFREVEGRRLSVDEAVLLGWIGEIIGGGEQPGMEAVAAALGNDSPAVRQVLRRTLTDGPLAGDGLAMRVLAGRVLCWLGDTESADSVADLLEILRSQGDLTTAFGHVTTALEVLGDPSVAGRLQAMIPETPDRQVYWLARAISALTGHCPPLPECLGDGDDPMRRWRQDWVGIDLTRPPVPRADFVMDGSRAEVVVWDGLARFALRPDPPEFDSGWPEWQYAWCHDARRVYRTGSVCDTCAVWLVRVGWAPDTAVRLAQAVRDEVSDVDAIDEPLLTALRPLLVALAAGRYQLRLVDLPLEATTWADTWFADDAPVDCCDEGDAPRPHPDELVYRLPDRDNARWPFVVAPTQPDTALDPARVADYRQAIAAGRRPAVIVAAERQGWDASADAYRPPHRSVTGFIIDGHHKAAAYTSLDVSTRTILICDRMPRQQPGTDDPLAIFDELLSQT